MDSRGRTEPNGGWKPARILYADEQGRRRIAQAFNDAIHEGRISAPIVLGRDHHDVSGTDSPTEKQQTSATIYVHSRHGRTHFVGDAFRGATWVSLHNGGGDGEKSPMAALPRIDGSKESSTRLQQMLGWDVNNGIARRAWARNSGAEFAIRNAMERNNLLHVTLPQHADDAILDQEFP